MLYKNHVNDNYEYNHEILFKLYNEHVEVFLRYLKSYIINYLLIKNVKKNII